MAITSVKKMYRINRGRIVDITKEMLYPAYNVYNSANIFVFARNWFLTLLLIRKLRLDGIKRLPRSKGKRISAEEERISREW